MKVLIVGPALLSLSLLSACSTVEPEVVTITEIQVETVPNELLYFGALPAPYSGVVNGDMLDYIEGLYSQLGQCIESQERIQQWNKCLIYKPTKPSEQLPRPPPDFPTAK